MDKARVPKCRRNEEWTKHETCFMLAYCVLFYILGVLLLYWGVLLGLGFIIVASLVFIPSLSEAKKKLAEYVKTRRMEKLRKTREVIIVGGTPQKHHKKKQKHELVVEYPTIDDSVSKGKVMRELGLSYEKKKQKVSFTETTPKHTKSVPGRTYRQLNDLFDALDYYKRIRITHAARIGSAGHHGSSIKKMVEAEAKRREVSLSVRMKGKDIIIEKCNQQRH